MTMKSEYDFSKGKRGKFYDPEAPFRIPVYLDPDVDQYIQALAGQSGQDVETLVNEWLRSNIQLIQSVQPAANV